jgi:RNA polymerase sigma factor (TIGR02999 family)
VGDITLMLDRMARGDVTAANELYAQVYAELRQVAAGKMARESAAQTLQPTALVHEAWLRLGGEAQPEWRNRRHFFAAAAEAMRRILIEQARKRSARRHGGGQQRLNVADLDLTNATPDESALAINDALERLAQIDPAKAELVKLRYFVGLTLPEAALALEISEATAKRWWSFARAWLFRAISGDAKN